MSVKKKYIIIGNSRSGKSTLAKKLLNELNGNYIDIIDYVISFIKENHISPKETRIELLKIPYEKLCNDLKKDNNWTILEIASDFPGEFLPTIINTTNPKPTVIFCDCPYEVCVTRNAVTQRKVPVELITHQSQYNREYYEDICAKLDVKLIVLDTTKKIFDKKINTDSII